MNPSRLRLAPPGAAARVAGVIFVVETGLHGIMQRIPSSPDHLTAIPACHHPLSGALAWWRRLETPQHPPASHGIPQRNAELLRHLGVDPAGIRQLLDWASYSRSARTLMGFHAKRAAVVTAALVLSVISAVPATGAPIVASAGEARSDAATTLPGQARS